MSQFGYAEEQGENKARADIYAVISPPLITPAIPHHIECTVCYHVLWERTNIVAFVAESSI